MTTTQTIRLDGKTYEADINFDGAIWQVIAYGPKRDRRVVSEHETAENARKHLASLSFAARTKKDVLGS